jgi:hypothetical protein
MNYLNYIFFDTSTLISENWPQLSAKLTYCLQLATAMEKKVCFPSVVEQELEIKWLVIFDEKCTQLKKSIEKINKHLLANDLVKIELPDREVALKEYRKKVKIIKDLYHVESIDRPQVDKDTLINMAINYNPPFEEGDKGFKDTIILFSILEHMQKEKSADGLIITQDQIFYDDEISELARKRGLNLKVIESVDQLLKELKKTLNVHMEETYRSEQKKATNSLETISEKIKKFILDNIEFNIEDLLFYQHRLGGKIIKIDKLELGTIKNVIPARLEEVITRKGKGRFPISFDVEIMLYVDVLKQPTAKHAPEITKVGDYFMRLITTEGTDTQTTETLNLSVHIEATSEIINQEYNIIELISAHLQRVI